MEALKSKQKMIGMYLTEMLLIKFIADYILTTTLILGARLFNEIVIFLNNHPATQWKLSSYCLELFTLLNITLCYLS